MNTFKKACMEALRMARQYNEDFVVVQSLEQADKFIAYRLEVWYHNPQMNVYIVRYAPDGSRHT